MIYIYKLIDPISKEIRYVGKTTNIKRRLSSHISESKKNKGSRYVLNWIYSLIIQGLKPIIDLIEICTVENWEEREQYWIRYYRESNSLCNHSNGGLGVTGKGSKSTLSADQREIISKRAIKTFSKHSDSEKKEIWAVVQNNTLKDSIMLDNRVSRGLYFQLRTGRCWNDITKLKKPKLRGKNIGSNHPNSKLSEKDILEIRNLHEQGFSQKQIRFKFNISSSQVSRIINKQNWM